MLNSTVIKLEGLNNQQAMNLVGHQDKNLNLISELYKVELIYRNDEFIILDADEEVSNKISKLLNSLYSLLMKNMRINLRDIVYLHRLIEKNKEFNYAMLFSKVIAKTLHGKEIAPKTLGQYEFVEAMQKKDIIFAIGPAGTGKTYLAVIQAVAMLKKNEVKRIVLTRPAVEAGENLGFLPGDLKEKVDPYLRPLYDGLHAMLGAENCEKYIEKGIIEIAPLAYMRGRTLEDAFVILDEAQNTTSAQMKMFLTRLGFNSKMVITGDITQIDLAKGKDSGLKDVTKILQGIKEIAILELSSDDVVRHPLVQKIVESYAKKGV